MRACYTLNVLQIFRLNSVILRCMFQCSDSHFYDQCENSDYSCTSELQSKCITYIVLCNLVIAFCDGVGCRLEWTLKVFQWSKSNNCSVYWRVQTRLDFLLELTSLILLLSQTPLMQEHNGQSVQRLKKYVTRAPVVALGYVIGLIGCKLTFDIFHLLKKLEISLLRLICNRFGVL